MYLRSFFFAGLAIFCTSSTLLAESQQALLDEALSNHRIARDSIHTFYCRVLFSSSPERRGLFPQAEYWRSPDAIRIRSQRGDNSEDVLVQNSRVTTIVKEKKSRGEDSRAAISQMNVPLSQCDVWALGLLTFSDPQNGWVTLDELMNGEHKVNAVKRRTEGDREFIYIDLEQEKSRLEIWLDPHVNYLARKMYITNLKGVNTRGESEVIRFKEAEPGIYFPEKVETRAYYDNNLTGITTKTFTDIRINQPIRPDVFQLHYPSGIMVMDTIQGKLYTVDSEGRPVGEVKDLQHVQTPPLRARANSQTATEFEPKSWTRWILPASLGVLAVGVISWLIRKRSGKRLDQSAA